MFYMLLLHPQVCGGVYLLASQGDSHPGLCSGGSLLTLLPPQVVTLDKIQLNMFGEKSVKQPHISKNLKINFRILKLQFLQCFLIFMYVKFSSMCVVFVFTFLFAETFSRMSQTHCYATFLHTNIWPENSFRQILWAIWPNMMLNAVAAMSSSSRSIHE